MEEKDLISLIKKFFNYKDKSILVGIGDDCAVIKNNSSTLVITTDDMVDGTHFLSDFLTPKEIASRLVRMNVSDIYAMGKVKPLYSLTNASMPKTLSDRWINDFIKELKNELDLFGIKNIGGNLSYSPILHFTMTIIGEIKGRVIKRNTAGVGDVLCILGEAGFSSVAVGLMRRKKRRELTDVEKRIISFFSKPPLFLEFRDFVSDYATSMIDNSDGIYKTSQIISEENSLGVVLDGNLLYEVSANCVKKILNYNKHDVITAVLESDDYNCVFTVSRNDYEKVKSIGFINKIGYLEKGKGVKILNYEDKRIKTFEHF